MSILVSIIVAAINSAIPFFETSINGKILNSQNTSWKTVSQSCDTLSNGAILVQTEFAGQKEWSGLRVIWDRETFGEEDFTRERLRLRSTRSGRYRFTDIDGRCHLLFPRYEIHGEVSDVTETRIATFDKESLPNYNSNLAMDNRHSRNLSGCYMFHPCRISHKIPCEVKGPFLSANINQEQILMSYEHASQDNVWTKERALRSFGDIESEDDLWFISLKLEYAKDGIVASGSVRRGAYYDGEPIPTDRWYETAWYTFSRTAGTIDDAIHDYLYDKITDHKLARRPEFYYNTWGMQTTLPGSNRSHFTEKEILEEIERSAKLGIETFVFDDGWQKDFGEWTPHPTRLPNGLEPLINALKANNITPGIWIALLACNKNAPVVKEHPEWVVNDPTGEVISREWGHYPMDITGGYYDYLLTSLKALTDAGIRFFKWDGINTFSSDLANLGHGDATTDVRERIDRYNYLLPFKVTSLMRELREYCPDVVIELDLTEPHRAMIGLMPLQEGKLFWMNNGASDYDDYSLTRAKSMRAIASEYASIFPVEALTYAVYPFDVKPIYPLRYNMCTGIQAGHGYWGSLAQCTEKDYETVHYYTTTARRILNKVSGSVVRKIGTIGSSPEIYLQQKEGYALLTGFSGAACEVPFTVNLDRSKVLGVIGHAFTLSDEGVKLTLQFSYPDDCRAVFVVGNDGKPYSITRCTGWLKTLEFKGDQLHIVAGSNSEISINTPSGAKTFKLQTGEDIIL